MDHCRLGYLRRRLSEQGLSSFVVDRCLASWKNTKNYDSTWRLWAEWCRDNSVGVDSIDFNRGVSFVADLTSKRKWIPGTAENALSHIQATLDLANGSTVRTRFFVGLRRLTPATHLDAEGLSLRSSLRLALLPTRMSRGFEIIQRHFWPYI